MVTIYKVPTNEEAARYDLSNFRNATPVYTAEELQKVIAGKGHYVYVHEGTFVSVEVAIEKLGVTKLQAN